MNVYLDASVILRRLRREAAPITGWGSWGRAYSSVLSQVEVSRTIDRLRMSGLVKDEQVALLLQQAGAIFSSVDLVPLGDAVLQRAAQSFLTPLGTLDALHLATALRLVENGVTDLTFLTHDSELALGARSVQMVVMGA